MLDKCSREFCAASALPEIDVALSREFSHRKSAFKRLLSLPDKEDGSLIAPSLKAR